MMLNKEYVDCGHFRNNVADTISPYLCMASILNLTEKTYSIIWKDFLGSNPGFF